MSSRDERRAAPRVKLFQPIELEFPTSVHRGHLLNLSTSGALVYASGPMPAEPRLRLRCGFSLGPARIAWRDGPRFGVAFDRPLTRSQFDALMGVQQAIYDAFRRRTVEARA